MAASTTYHYILVHIEKVFYCCSSQEDRDHIKNIWYLSEKDIRRKVASVVSELTWKSTCKHSQLVSAILDEETSMHYYLVNVIVVIILL